MVFTYNTKIKLICLKFGARGHLTQLVLRRVEQGLDQEPDSVKEEETVLVLGSSPYHVLGFLVQVSKFKFRYTRILPQTLTFNSMM